MAPAENLPPANMNKYLHVCVHSCSWTYLSCLHIPAAALSHAPKNFPRRVPPFPDHLLLSSIACPHTYPECGPRHADTQMHAHGHAAWWSIIEKEPIPFLIKVCVHGFRCVFRLQPGDQPVLDDSRQTKKNCERKRQESRKRSRESWTMDRKQVL